MTTQSIAQSPAVNDPIYGANSFLFKSPFKVKDSTVTFFLKGHLDAKKVIVTGYFTNWSTTDVLMTTTDSGWKADIKLPPGRHSYKFIIDDNWTVDTANKLSETTPEGYINSIYYKTNHLFILPGFKNAKSVYLTGSFINWRKNELKMEKTGRGWELPLYLSSGTYLYRFLVDGKACTDPNNRNHLLNENNEQSSYVLIGKPDELYIAIQSGQKAIDANDTSFFKRAIADHQETLGYLYLRQGNYTNACQSFQNAAMLYQRLQNLDSAGSMFSNMALAYEKLSDFPRRLEYSQKALSNYIKTGNKYREAMILRQIGAYYGNYSSPAMAIEYFNRALIIFEQLNLQNEIGKILAQIGHMYLFLRDSANSFFYLQKALNLNQQLGNKNVLAYNFWILGDCYFRLKSEITVAIEYLQKAQDLYEQTGDKGRVPYILFNFADIFLYAPDTALEKAKVEVGEKYIRSIEYQKRGIEMAKYMEWDYGMVIHYLVLSETYEKIGMYDSAYHYYKQYIALRDKVIGTEKQKEMVRLETRYQNEIIEDSLKLANQLTDERLQKQILLADQQQQQLALSNKEKELQHLAYLKTQADLQNEQLSRQQKEKQLSLSEKEKELQSTKVKALTQERAITKLNQQRQWIYFAGIFIVLAFASLYFIYRWRLRSVRLKSQLAQEKSEQLQKEAEFQHKLADIKLLALRAQMNPHFIFNSMNSIKSLINKNENDKAASYLTTFSKLIRTLFNNSDKREVSLFEELQTCQLYTQLEKMRFGDKIEFTFDVDNQLDLKDIKVPALILQPFIENSIWHGLVPKESGGKVTVSVKQNNDSVECIIDDDGIGRELSKKFKADYEATHQSKGIGLTQSRLELDKLLNEREDAIFIIDKEREDGQPEGTKVIITFKDNHH